MAGEKSRRVSAAAEAGPDWFRSATLPDGIALGYTRDGPSGWGSTVVIPRLRPTFAFSRKLGSLHFREELYRSAEIAAPPSSRLFLYDAKMGSSADDNVVRGIARSLGMIVTRPDRYWSRRVFSAECRPRRTRSRPAATRCATSGWPENRRSSAACR